MPEDKPAKARTRTSPGTTADAGAFTEDERAAMREYAAERKIAARRSPAARKAEGENDVLAKIAEMPQPDRAIAERLHVLIKEAAPQLVPRTWYGMPAYALDGNVLCFFQNAAKFKARYSTLGFNDAARLDDGAMWPTSYALLELTPVEEARITELVRRACATD
ncbi:MAG: DUF1801 domain-containing protein [Dehalococcoidia bacterium]